ncbi:MAG: serine hydrolase domain-containing protein [Pyrinomonadaceae bacterium]
MQKKFKLVFIVISLLLPVFVFAGNGGAGRTEIKTQAIDDFLKQLSDKGFSGSVLVSDGNSVFNKCYGFADRENKTKCSEHTVYDIGSVTKQFTGAAILKLEMQGKLSPSDTIDKYFSNLPADKKAITIHQLLTHSSGLPPAIGDDYEALGREAFLKRAFGAKLNSKPGEEYDYSNVGYSILAAIIEKVSGSTYEQFLNENLFAPAGMKETGYTIPKWKTQQIAVGYKGENKWGRPTEKKWDSNAPFWNLLGNGGLLSTTADLYKWHQALLTDKILNKNAKEQYYKRHIEEGANAGTYYGYGWALFPTPRKTTLIAHNGGNGIFFCDFLRYTEEKVTIILLSNSMRREFEAISVEIARSIFSKDHKPVIEVNTSPPVKTTLENHPHVGLIRGLMTTITSQDKDAVKKFAEVNFAEDFLNYVPIEKHLEILSQIGGELKDFEIESVTINGIETLIRFKDKENEMLIEIEKGKILGIRF